MANFLTAASQFADDFLCALLQSQSDWNDYADGAARSVTGLPEDVPLGYEFPYDLALSTACRLGRNPGNPEFGNPSVPAPGQCPVTYLVAQPYSYKFQNVPDNETATSILTGPISNIKVNTPPAGGLFFTADTGNGVQQFGSRGGVGYSEVILGAPTFTRQDGGVDNCSTPPISGDNPPVGDGDITYEPVPGGPSITIPVGVAIAVPIINLNGELNIPITLDIGGLTIDLSKNLYTGDISLGGPGNDCCEPKVKPVPQVNNPEDPPLPGPSSPSIVGLFISATVADDAPATRFKGTYGPYLYVPRIAVVRFAQSIGGRQGWSEKLDVTSTSQYLPVPQPGFAYDFVVNAMPGVTYNARPVTLDE